jgi:hypothetical protein
MPQSPWSHAWCRHAAAWPNGKNPNTTAVPAGRLFFPQSKSLGLDRAQYSKAVLSKIVYAGSNNTSYQQAHGDLDQLAELDVTAKQVRRLCKRIGGERVAERDAAVAAYQALPLVERKSAPAGVRPQQVIAIGVDGGRMQIFDRSPGSTAATAQPATAVTEPVATASAAGAEEDDDERRGQFWREDKIGLLLTMHSEVSADDPCPQIPKTFLNPTRMSKLVRELKKRAPPREEAAKTTDAPDAAVEALQASEARWEPPQVQAKQVVATRRPWAEFGPLVAAAAWASGFFAAERKAFVADGAANNWTLHQELFSSFVPILDFIHGLSYVFASAMAGRGFKEGWTVYERWIQWLWSGEVEQVLVELAVRQAELGPPAKDEAEGQPRAVVARALTYLQNNQERMRYADYRRQGLPLTSSYVESAVKQINYRVKGTEKFWNEAGAEELLQLRADYLSDGDVMNAYWKRREANETGQNRYRRAK